MCSVFWSFSRLLSSPFHSSRPSSFLFTRLLLLDPACTVNHRAWNLPPSLWRGKKRSPQLCHVSLNSLQTLCHVVVRLSVALVTSNKSRTVHLGKPLETQTSQMFTESTGTPWRQFYQIWRWTKKKTSWKHLIYSTDPHPPHMIMGRANTSDYIYNVYHSRSVLWFCLL